MTGFRDKELSAQFEKLGIIQPSSISKQLFILLVKSKEESNTKINEAKNLGIPILTVNEFKEKYNTQPLGNVESNTNQPLGKVEPNTNL